MVFSIEQLGLIGLFLNTFLSASILPLPSEPGIFLAISAFDKATVFFVALIGGVLGSITNYYIGLKGLHGYLVERDPQKEKKAQKILDKYGYTVLLVSPWIPFVGDPLMIIAGALRMDFGKFLIIAFLGRVIKTAAIVFLSVSLLA